MKIVRDYFNRQKSFDDNPIVQYFSLSIIIFLISDKLYGIWLIKKE